MVATNAGTAELWGWKLAPLTGMGTLVDGMERLQRSRTGARARSAGREGGAPQAGGWQWLFGAVLVTLALTLPRASGAGYGSAKQLGRLQDPAVQESSGVASSSRSDRFFFTHNDSGDSARFFAVDMSGRTVATFQVPGAKNVDWEDMARTRDERGRSVLYFGDIGDNTATRKSIQVYRVEEPEVNPDRPGQARSTGTAEVFTLQYPDGPRDAETLMADPSGRLYLVSKSPAGSTVYAAPHPLVAGKTNRLRPIGSIQFLFLPGGDGGVRTQLRRLLATGGAISPDGKRLVIRTYADAYEWDLPGGDVAAGLKGKARRVPLPAMQQGEAIAYTRDGRGLLTTTEGRKAPFFLVPPQGGPAHPAT